MARVEIVIETEEKAWVSYIAAVHGDDGAANDATPEELAARDAKARSILLANIAKTTADHAEDRRVKEAAAQIKVNVEAEKALMLAATVITARPVG